MNLTEEFNLRGPWITKFEINGISYGGNFDGMRDNRIVQFFDEFPEVKTVLELGSLEGGHSFALAQNPSIEKVIAIKTSKKHNLSKNYWAIKKSSLLKLI